MIVPGLWLYVCGVVLLVPVRKAFVVELCVGKSVCAVSWCV